MRVIHKMNGVEITPRVNDIKITKVFGEEAVTSIGKIDFAGEAAKRVMERIDLSIFEGEPYTIEIGSFLFDGYLDFTNSIKEGCDEVSCDLKKRRGDDWLNDVADGFSFRFLEDENIIKKSDFIKVPYIINSVPDKGEILILSMSLFMMTKEGLQAVKEVSDAAADVVDASTPVVGTGGVSYDVGNIIMVALKLAIRIVYLIAIIIAIKKMLADFIEQFFPKQKYHLGIKISTLFRKACEHLGLTLSSDLLSETSKWVFIPRKSDDNRKTGVPALSSEWSSFGDLIRNCKELFNADYKITGSVFSFERIDRFSVVGNFNKGDFFTNQAKLKDTHGTNANEMTANYVISWSTDTQDINTLSNTKGEIYQAITEINNYVNKDLVSIKNLTEINIPATLGLRKNELTKIEKIVKGLAHIVDKLTSVIGRGATNYEAKISARKGSLLLSGDYLSAPKIITMSGGKVEKNQRQILSARSLWEKYHYINSLAEIDGEHNQWLIIKGEKISFCEKDFTDIEESNYFSNSQGNLLRIDRIEWDTANNTAIIDYRIKEKYATNLNVKFLE